MAATGGEIVRVVRSGSFADPAVPAGAGPGPDELREPGRDREPRDAARGAWPRGRQRRPPGDPVRRCGRGDGSQRRRSAVAREPARPERHGRRRRERDVAVDPADAVWLGDPLETAGVRGRGTFTTRGPSSSGKRTSSRSERLRSAVEVSWRACRTSRRSGSTGVDELRNGTNGLAGQPPRPPPGRGRALGCTTVMPALLRRRRRSVLVSRSGVILLTIQFAVLAGYADRPRRRDARRAAPIRDRPDALARGERRPPRSRWPCSRRRSLADPGGDRSRRGWPSGSLRVLGTVGPTAGLGLATSAAVSVYAIVVSALAGLACIVALTLPTLFVSASPAGARAAEGRQARTTLPQRLGLDLALVAVAAVALWQLRLYGAPLTLNARGTLGLDPLLVAAPAIGLVGGAVLALARRASHRRARRAAARPRPGLVGSLGWRQLARRPLRYTRAALLPDARGGTRDAGRGSRRDVGPVAGGPGDIPGRGRRPGPRRRLQQASDVGRRPALPIDPGRPRCVAGHGRPVRPRPDDPRRPPGRPRSDDRRQGPQPARADGGIAPAADLLATLAPAGPTIRRWPSRAGRSGWP